ncbi:MAG: glycoside hydrolase family 97 protein [Bacteroidaceae bacterium]|nr:glycoside hydrolase family 97 protein [Bacteroidaceae bacterium]
MKRILSVFVIALSFVPAFGQTSPNGKIKVSSSDLGLTVSYQSLSGWQTIYTAEMPGIGKGVSRKATETYDMIVGKQHHISKPYVESAYPLAADGSTLVVRAFDDGVAFRKECRGAAGSKAEVPVVVDFSSARSNWLLKWSDSYEGFFPKNTDTKDGDRWAYPTLFEYNDGVFALLSESCIEKDNAASCLYSTSRKGVFRIQPDENDQNPESSPWRVAIVGRISDVVESTLISDLAAPARLTDTSWIEPGVASWVYWAYNHGSNDYNIIKKYVDMAAELKLPYVLIDAEWDEMPKLASNNGKTIEDAVRYAVDKGVKPMIWYNSSVGWIDGAPTPKFRLNKPEDREKEFAWCEKIGVTGVKIDFFSGDNNMNMKYMIELLEDAAKHHLLVNFHGATIPRGWQRTYPNLVSTEGVYGAEWYNNVPTFTKRAAAHNATIPFTRNVVGSMDYTPCAFTDSQHPHITTHAHELALTAMYESGIQHLADRPESFLAQPQQVKDYLSDLPTAWDETRLLGGYPSDYVIMARRKGSAWYISGINGTDEVKNVALDVKPLKRLGSRITMFLDSGDAAHPWNIKQPKSVPTQIGMLPRGGFLIVINK